MATSRADSKPDFVKKLNLDEANEVLELFSGRSSVASSESPSERAWTPIEEFLDRTGNNPDDFSTARHWISNLRYWQTEYRHFETVMRLIHQRDKHQIQDLTRKERESFALPSLKLIKRDFDNYWKSELEAADMACDIDAEEPFGIRKYPRWILDGDGKKIGIIRISPIKTICSFSPEPSRNLPVHRTDSARVSKSTAAARHGPPMTSLAIERSDEGHQGKGEAGLVKHAPKAGESAGARLRLRRSPRLATRK